MYIYNLEIMIDYTWKRKTPSSDQSIVMSHYNEIVSVSLPKKYKVCFRKHKKDLLIIELLSYVVQIWFESLAFDPEHVVIMDEHCWFPWQLNGPA